MPAVVRRNRGEIAHLPERAIIESPLTLKGGQVVPHGYVLPDDLIEIMGEVAETNSLAARAAMGDHSALRECIEIDPALSGLDRLYCQELVEKLMELHQDVLRLM